MDLRTLTHEHLDSSYDSSISRQFARFALGLEYESIPDEVVHQAKRSLLDALGCAIGAFDAPGRESCEAFVEAVGGRPESTVFGSGTKTSAQNAALVNSFLVRYLDYNDTGGGGHGSDAIPSLLAVSEREDATPEEFLTATVVAYELGARVRDAAGGSGGFKAHGWTSDVRGGVNMPPALGKLMGLTEGQIANAIGCCTSRNAPMRILDGHSVELTNTKNIRFGSVAYDAIMSCILAENGFTGPIRVVEGEGGMNEVLVDGEMDFEPMLDFGGWRILDVAHKRVCANHTAHGHILSTLSIVNENDLGPEDIESVRISAGARDARHMFNHARKYPRNGETANHSGYYTHAYAIKEGELGPESHDPENFTDPIILDLIERITVEVDPDLPERSSVGASEITTKDGETYRARKVPPGRGDNGSPRVSDRELEEKFADAAGRHLDDDTVEAIVDAVWNLEDLDDLAELAELTEAR